MSFVSKVELAIMLPTVPSLRCCCSHVSLLLRFATLSDQSNLKTGLSCALPKIDKEYVFFSYSESANLTAPCTSKKYDILRNLRHIKFQSQV